MKLKSTGLKLLLSVGLLLLLPRLAQAQADAHYVPGAEGIKGSSLPPPGIYFRDYNLFYTSDRLNNSSGQSVGPSNFNAFAYAQVPRFIWITDTKFLGGYVGVDGVLPFIYQSVKNGSYNSSSFGVGDLLAEGSLSWHLQQFDIGLGCGIWMPTGDSAPPPTTRPGLGYWTTMLTAGSTWYIDKDKTWAVSALNRYEFNSEQRDTHITPGQAFTLDWGISKTFDKTIDVGLVGYYQQKVTADSGTGASTKLDYVAAIGPEISGVIPKVDVQVSLRYLNEFIAENRTQGQTITLTLTKHF